MTAGTVRTPLWRDRRFATYWAGQGISQFGDRITELALPLIAVTSLHASARTVGLLTAAVWAPNLISLFIGTWVDQQRRSGTCSSPPTCFASACCSAFRSRTGSAW